MHPLKNFTFLESYRNNPKYTDDSHFRVLAYLYDQWKIESFNWYEDALQLIIFAPYPNGTIAYGSGGKWLKK